MPVNRTDLLERLRLHEDSFVERKTEADDFRPTLVAFANSVPSGRDAVLFIGVRDDGTIDGVQNSDSLQKKLHRTCSENCFPPIAFTTEILPIQDKIIVAVVIPPSDKRPHFAGSAYVRQGTKNIQASQRLLGELIEARNSIVAELLRHRDQFVSVVSAKSRLGRPEFERVRAGTSAHNPVTAGRAKIVDVNSFFVRMDLGGTLFSEPLENISISYDDQNHRLMIFVHLDRP